jgi:hypothetical protein
VHHPRHELGGLRVVEALVERQRAPRGEGERVADRGALARARPPARAPAMQQRLARGLDVAVVAAKCVRTSSDTGSSRIRFSIIPAVRR